jgi:hypothetical protein
MIFASALLAATALAQGPHGQGGPNNASRTNSGINMALQSKVDGAITSVQLAYGAQYPSIVVNKTQIKIAPVWFLLDNDFELTVGDVVSVLVAPSNNTSDSYLFAIRITKTASGADIVLRSELGIPLWTGPADGRGGNPQGPRTGDNCIDMTSIKTAKGTIDRVNSGVGIQMPTLTLKLDNGSLLTVKIGSERLLLASDFELNPGDVLTVKYAQCTCADELVALQLTDAKGNTLTLRNDDGTPVHN